MNKKFKFVVVGGGTAGMMAASYLKSYWGDVVDVNVVYDKAQPAIGVGESLTPMFRHFMETTNVTIPDLIKNANATFKLGLKFKNWLGDGSYYYHPFTINRNNQDTYNYSLASAICDSERPFKCYETHAYDSVFFEQDTLPINDGFVVGDFSFHIDALMFSEFLAEKFKDKITITNQKIVGINKKVNGEIESLVCDGGNTIMGDFFVDCTGFQRNIFKHLDNVWIDRKNWLPLNSCIPNPLFTEFTSQPVYTTSECSEDGWILQVPLANRWGTGYLYNSSFCSDEEAFDKFEKFISKNYGQKLNNTSRVIRFESGFWDKQWVKNCLSLGLSSGFTEPLEATNIHQMVFQLQSFVQMFNFKIFEHDINYYNKKQRDMYENIYLYTRFCYCNGMKEGKFWEFIYNNEPKEVSDLKEKISSDVVNSFNLSYSPPFDYFNFSIVAAGLNLIDKPSYRDIFNKRNTIQSSKGINEYVKTLKLLLHSSVVKHKSFLDSIKNTK